MYCSCHRWENETRKLTKKRVTVQVVNLQLQQEPLWKSLTDFGDNTCLQSWGCEVLKLLFYNDTTNVKLAIKGGCIGVLLSTLASGRECRVRFRAAHALRSIMAFPVLCGACISNEDTAHILKVMKEHAHDPAIQENGCVMFVLNLNFRDDAKAWLDGIGNEGIDVLIQVVHNHCYNLIVRRSVKCALQSFNVD